MYKNNVLNKGWVVIVILLFVGMSMLPASGSISIERVSTDNQIYESNSRNNNDTTPPVTTIHLDPAVPNGLNGWYVDPVEVTLIATDDMSGVKVTYYSINRGPWNIYTDPFIIDAEGATIVDYFSIDNACNPEIPKNECIKIDETPPLVDLTAERTGNIILELKVKVTATCYDETSSMSYVEFFMTGEYKFTDDTAPYEWVFDWPDGVGIVTVTGKAYDMAGNIGEDNIHVESLNQILSNHQGQINNQQTLPTSTGLLDDTTPPVTTISFDPPYPDGDNGWYVSDVTITLEATDDMSGVDVIKYLLDDSDWLTYTGPFTVESDGYHGITYYAVDKAGNVEQPSEVIRFGIDQTPPTIEVTCEVSGDDLIFTATCSDATSGMDRVEFYMNDVLAFTDDTEPYVWILYYDGWLWTYKATAFDTAGNSAFVIVSDSYSNSQSSSSQQSSSSSSSRSSESVIPTTGTEIVENKNVEQQVSNPESRGAELEVTTDKDVYDPGETVTIYLTNIGDEILYGGGPIITIYNNEGEIVFQEATYCWHELEPEEYITWTWDQTDQQGSQVPNGFYVVEGALYGVGETFVDSSIFAVTEEDLVVHIDGIEGENGWYVSCVTITVLYDPEVIKEVYVNGEIYVEPVVICEDGEHDVEIKAVDWEGNWMSPMSICFRIDQTGPSVDITWEATGNNLIGWKVKWTATAADYMSGMDRVDFRINNVVQFTDYEEPYEWIIEWSSVFGGLMFSATAFDNAGNSAWDSTCPPEIQSQSNSQSNQQSSTPLFFQILQRLLNTR